jgi:hypothetical protein
MISEILWRQCESEKEGTKLKKTGNEHKTVNITVDVMLTIKIVIFYIFFILNRHLNFSS